MGDMKQVKPCGNPNCRCTDCDGNCKCGGANAMSFVPEQAESLFMTISNMIRDNVKYIALLLLLIFIVYMYMKKRRN
jgi:hypothetical protein